MNSPMSRVSDQEPEISNLIIVEYNLISSAREALPPLPYQPLRLTSSISGFN